MELSGFLKGLAVGLAIAAPVGPIALLCIRRTLASGRLCGFASGLGAATADAFYGCVAAFGLTFISSALVRQQMWLRVGGGLFLIFLGIRTMLAKSKESDQEDATVAKLGILAAYSSTLVLTLMNPSTILSFAAIFSGIDAPKEAATAAAMVGGVFLGSAVWWLFLSGGIGLFRSRVNERGMAWINRISGLCLMGFGVAAIVTLFRS